MTIRDYLKKADEICKQEFISGRELVTELDIAYNTLLRIRRNPDKCSLKTAKKIKIFVEKWRKEPDYDNAG